VSPYYALQAEDGGVFDDPMATALYLELLVREQNALERDLSRVFYLILFGNIKSLLIEHIPMSSDFV
jgi:hypothetical protein